MKNKISLYSALILVVYIFQVFSAQGETIASIDFSGQVPKPEWHYFEKKWKIENHQGVPSLAPEPEIPGAKDADLWQQYLAVGFKPNTPDKEILPLAVDCTVVVFSNGADANRFCISFAMDMARNTTFYSAMIRPGGLCEIQEGADFGQHTVLAKSQERVTFPEGSPVHVKLVWHENGLLELLIDGQSVVKTDTPVPPTPAPFSLWFWERFGKREAKTRVLLQQITVSQSAK